MDLRRLLVEAASSTVTTFNLLFDGVPGFDLSLEMVDPSPSPTASRSPLLERDEGDRSFSSFSLTREPPLPSFFFSSSAAFCRSVFFRCVLRGRSLTLCGDRSRLIVSGATGSVVNGGLGGGAPVLIGASCSACFPLLLSRSVGSGV